MLTRPPVCTLVALFTVEWCKVFGRGVNSIYVLEEYMCSVSMLKIYTPILVIMF